MRHLLSPARVFGALLLAGTLTLLAPGQASALFDPGPYVAGNVVFTNIDDGDTGFFSSFATNAVGNESIIDFNQNLSANSTGSPVNIFASASFDVDRVSDFLIEDISMDASGTRTLLGDGGSADVTVLLSVDVIEVWDPTLQTLVSTAGMESTTVFDFQSWSFPSVGGWSLSGLQISVIDFLTNVVDSGTESAANQAIAAGLLANGTDGATSVQVNIQTFLNANGPAPTNVAELSTETMLMSFNAPGSEVPEPATGLLVALGLVSLAATRRWR